MKKIWAGKLLISIVTFSQGLVLELVLPGLNHNAVLTAAKLLETTLEITHICQFAVAVLFSWGENLNLWKLFSFNSTDKVPAAVTGKENFKNEKLG